MITPDSGYSLPNTISISVDGKALSSTQFTYNATTGQFTVYGKYITGALKVSANCVSLSKPTVLVQAKNTGKTIKLSWSKVTGATKYVVFGGKCQKAVNGKKTYFKLKTLNASSRSYKKQHCQSGKSYKFYVVAYKGSARLTNNFYVHVLVKTHKGYANATKVTLKESSASLDQGKTYQIAAQVKTSKGKKVFYKGHTALKRYVSSNASIASVDASGKVTGLKAGQCKIYVIATDGVKSAMTMTVK